MPPGSLPPHITTEDRNQKPVDNPVDKAYWEQQKNGFTSAPVLPTDKWKVHGEYNWALNLGSNTDDVRKYVPYIHLKEYNLTSSSQLNAYRLFISQLQAELNVANFTGPISNSFLNNLIAQGIIPGTGQGDVYLGPNNENKVGSFSQNSPYYGLYQGKETGNEYYLPYLNPQSMTSNLGSWKSIDGKDLAKSMSGAAPTAIAGIPLGGPFETTIKIVKALGADLGNVATAAELASKLAGTPGITKETIKAFTPNETGDTITTTFYLFNTQSAEDIKRNWEFLFTLTYQNLPNRKSLVRMDPPCIYTVEVPGFKRFPVAVISALKVDNVGTTRLVDITNGEMMPVEDAANNLNVKIVPEAYKVTLTIQSLLINSRNLFYYGKNGPEGAKIQVITGGPTTVTPTPTVTPNPGSTPEQLAAAYQEGMAKQPRYHLGGPQ